MDDNIFYEMPETLHRTDLEYSLDHHQIRFHMVYLDIRNSGSPGPEHHLVKRMPPSSRYILLHYR